MPAEQIPIFDAISRAKHNATNASCGLRLAVAECSTTGRAVPRTT